MGLGTNFYCARCLDQLEFGAVSDDFGVDLCRECASERQKIQYDQEHGA